MKITCWDDWLRFCPALTLVVFLLLFGGTRWYQILATARHETKPTAEFKERVAKRGKEFRQVRKTLDTAEHDWRERWQDLQRIRLAGDSASTSARRTGMDPDSARDIAEALERKRIDLESLAKDEARWWAVAGDGVSFVDRLRLAPSTHDGYPDAVAQASLASIAFSVRKRTAQVTWKVMVGLYATLCLVAMGIGVWLPGFSGGKAGGGANDVVRWGLIYLLIGICAYVLAVELPRRTPWYQSNIFSFSRDLSLREKMIRIDAVGLWIALLYAFGFARILVRHGAVTSAVGDGDTGSEQLEWLSVQSRYVQWSLYIGTGLLVGNILMARQLYQWATLYIPPDPSGQLTAALADLFNAELTGRGIVATAVLAAVYVPVAAIIRLRALDAVGSHTAPSQRRALLENYGLTAISPWEQARPTLAVIAPLLAGWVSSVLPKV